MMMAFTCAFDLEYAIIVRTVHDLELVAVVAPLDDGMRLKTIVQQVTVTTEIDLDGTNAVCDIITTITTK